MTGDEFEEHLKEVRFDDTASIRRLTNCLAVALDRIGVLEKEVAAIKKFAACETPTQISW